MTEQAVRRTLRYIREVTIDMEPTAYADYLDRMREEIDLLEELREWQEED